MFEKISKRVNTRLNTFVDDVKYLQRSLKKELDDLNATERDLRRLFHEDNKNSIIAEKLSYILENLEKLKNATGFILT